MKNTVRVKRSRETPPAVVRGPAHSGWAVALTLVWLTTGSCAALGDSPRLCKQLRSAPVEAGVTWLGEVRGEGRERRRSRAAVALFEGDGVSLYLFRAHRLFRPNDLYLCREIPQAEHQLWKSAIRQVLPQLDARPGEQREAVAAFRAEGGATGVAAVETLSPLTLETVGRLACLMITTFGESGAESLRETNPLLAERLSFPGGCSSTSSQSGPRPTI